MEGQLIRDAELKRPRPLAHLRLPSKVENALLRQGIRTIGQLISRSREDLVTEVRGLGSTGALAIVDALAGEGLTLANDAGEMRYPGKTRQHVLNHYAWLDPVSPTPPTGEPSRPSLVPTHFLPEPGERVPCPYPPQN